MEVESVMAEWIGVVVALALTALFLLVSRGGGGGAPPQRCVVTDLIVYPLKSAKGVRVASAPLDARGA